jgi:hypothetical protein
MPAEQLRSQHPFTLSIAARNAFLLVIGICSLGLGSPAASPGASMVQHAVRNLKQLRSFGFTLRMVSVGIPEVHGEFSGRVFLPDTEERSGYWLGVDGEVPLHLKSRGETEYSSEDTFWSVHTRSPETDFLTQLEGALSFDSFQTPKKQDKYLTIVFTPNLPFLDPMQLRKVSGTIRIRRDRMLIEEVIARSPDSTLLWQATLSDFDQAEPIAFPFVRQWRISLAPDPRPLTPGPRPPPPDQDTAALRSRFRSAGYELQCANAGDSLVLYLEREIRDDLLRLLTQPGELKLWVGRFAQPEAPSPVGVRVLALAGDSTKSMVLERALADREYWTRLEFRESLAERRVTLLLTRTGKTQLAGLKQLENSGSYCVLSLDDRVVGFAPIAHRSNPAQVSLSVSGSPLLVRSLAAIDQSRPLSARYRVVEKIRVRR